MKRASLGEIMGKQGASMAGSKTLSFDDLPNLVGEAMPDIPFDRVGRHRLINTLKGRFGTNFRNIPGIKDIIKDFDTRVEYEDKVRRMQNIRYRPKEKK